MPRNVGTLCLTDDVLEQALSRDPTGLNNKQMDLEPSEQETRRSSESLATQNPRVFA